MHARHPKSPKIQAYLDVLRSGVRSEPRRSVSSGGRRERKDVSRSLDREEEMGNKESES